MVNVEQCAGRLAEKLKKKFGNCWKTKDGKNIAEIGCFDVDNNSVYGGAKIIEITNSMGGETEPLGNKRMKPENFCDATLMSERAIEIDRKNRGKF